MALINCQECNNQISDSAKFCPHCGAPFNHSVGISSSNKTNKIIGGILCLIIGLVLYIYVMTKPLPRSLVFDSEAMQSYLHNASNMETWSFIIMGIGALFLIFAMKSKVKQ